MTVAVSGYLQQNGHAEITGNIVSGSFSVNSGGGIGVETIAVISYSSTISSTATPQQVRRGIGAVTHGWTDHDLNNTVTGNSGNGRYIALGPGDAADADIQNKHHSGQYGAVADVAIDTDYMTQIRRTGRSGLTTTTQRSECLDKPSHTCAVLRCNNINALTRSL